MPKETRTAIERRDLALLTASRAGEMLRLAFADIGQLKTWEVHQVHHRPGAGVSVGYRLMLGTMRAGAVQDLYVLATTAEVNPHKLRAVQGKRLRLGDTVVSLWQYPHDPELTALPLAADTGKFSELLKEPVDLELLGYRPTRRAVLRVVRVEKPALYAKVLRTSEQKQLALRLETMAKAQVPAPQIYLQQPGLLVMTAVPGISLAKLLARTSSRVLPKNRPTFTDLDRTFQSLWQLLESLPELPFKAPKRPAWAERAEYYGQAASLALPGRMRECGQIAKDIKHLLAHSDLGELRTVHGDFYEANVYVDPQTGLVSGILDLDSLGPGYLVHDWGCLLGHMSVLAYLSPKHYDAVPEIVQDWFKQLSAFYDARALAASASGVALSLVAGARKTGKKWDKEAENRLLMARQWLDLAQ